MVMKINFTEHMITGPLLEVIIHAIERRIRYSANNLIESGERETVFHWQTDNHQATIVVNKDLVCQNKHLGLGKGDTTWWHHQMATFSALQAICAGNSPVTGEFPAQRPVTRSFDIFLDLHLNKRLSKQSWGWWFEMPSRSLWRHCNEFSGAGLVLKS